MKLLTRTTLYFVAISLMVFSLGGFIFYHTLRTTTTSDADERLANEKSKIMQYVKSHHALPLVSDTDLAFGDKIVFLPIKMPPFQYPAPISIDNNAPKFSQKDSVHQQHTLDTIKDTTLYNPQEKEAEPYRMISFPISFDDKAANAMIFKPLIESDDLRDAIFQSLLMIGGVLFLVLILLDIFIARKTWTPFYDSLEKLRSFDLIWSDSISFKETKIKEFNTLNETLKNMTSKMSADYRVLKEFTENASHEIQTPLAIIQSKLELLIQSENLSQEQMQNVQAIYESASKLSRLNQALLLLTKIENRQFSDIKDVALHELVERKLELFKELIEHRHIKLEKHISPAIVKANPDLADILITNLVSNAIKHNIEGGKINIKISLGKLTIENLGAPLNGNSHDLFTRFKKGKQSSESLGLGLAIVKEICNVYGFKIHYHHSNETHAITVDF